MWAKPTREQIPLTHCRIRLKYVKKQSSNKTLEELKKSTL